MKLKELFDKLESSNIPKDKYYINGIYGSTDDENKPAMRLYNGNMFEIYSKERGEKVIKKIYDEEEDACLYMFKLIRQTWDFERILSIKNITKLSIEERLKISGMKDEFEVALAEDKRRAKEILKLLRVDQSTIKSIIND